MHRLPPQSSLSRSAVWLVIGLVLGFVLRSSFKTPATSAQKPEISSTKNVPANFEKRANVHGPKSTTRTDAISRLRALSLGPADLLACFPFVSELSAAECQEALGLFGNWPREARQTIEHLLARRWAKLDPEGVLSSAKKFRAADLSYFLLQEASRELAQRDPLGELKRLANISNSTDRTIFTRSILTTLAETDPATASHYLSTHSETRKDIELYREVGRLFAQQSVQQALEWANSLANGTARLEALGTIWETSAQKDPAGTASALKGVEASKQPEGMKIFVTVASAWSQVDPSAALTWIQSLPGKIQESAWKGFEPNAQQLGPEACLKMLDSIPAGPIRAHVAWNFAREMSQENVNAAIQWAEQVPAGEARSQALIPILDEWAASDPAAAVKYSASLPEGSSRSDLLARTVSRWAAEDSGAALQWTRDLPSGSARDVAAEQASRSLIGDRPEVASKWLDLIQNPRGRAQTAAEIAQGWSRLDPGAAAAWVQQLPDAETQVQAHQQIARTWAFEDPQATAKWLGTLPAGAARDSAIGGFVRSVDGYDAGLATQWASGITDSRQRIQYLIPTFQRWQNEGDATAAQAWRESSGLDEETRNALQQAVQSKTDETVRR